MFLYLLVLSTALSALLSAHTVPNMGHQCAPGEEGEKPGIRWYFDWNRGTTYPYYYYGCGASNWPLTPGDAMPMDVGSYCPGFVSNGGCGYDHYTRKDKTCSAGYFCIKGWKTGLCCQQSTADAYNVESHAPKCPKAAVTTNSSGYREEILIGKECAHKFCPTGSRCVQGEYIAYCCK